MSKERRRFERYQVDKDVAVGGVKGHIRDLSAGGAAIDLDDVGGLAEGDEIEIDIADFGNFKGDIIRLMDDGLALDFDLDEEEEARLVAELSHFGSDADYD